MTDSLHQADWPAELDDQELEELDQYLRAHAGEDHLLLDGVHGLLTAIGIGPEKVAPDEWLPEVLHEPFADEEEGKRVLELLARLSESVELEVEADNYEPILGEIELDDGDSALSALGWCEGFSRGVDLRARLWESRLGADSHLTELLGPIMALAVEEGVFATDADFAPLSEQEYDDCLAQLPGAVNAVAHYWVDAPLTPEELAGSPHRTSSDNEPRRKRGGRWLH
ncbi:MAG: YecA family protein [Rudaea sp.]|uniref:YecA/YgfB family protein n=1 Tax=unclassified Rudaea TaxID=2627037 RepID=UPI0010F7C0D1|nr:MULTISPECIES: YecA family protein [unclassified Rudaea]MBN8885300.1 YecA family protein [Rudaea sp.]MBR0345705.1 YecA family protein [Rudaea sp.]